MQGVNHDFFSSNRSIIVQSQYLNNDGMAMADEMESKYLNISLNLLVNELGSDVNIL